MYSSRLVHLVVVIISVVAFSQAAFFDLGLFRRSVKALEALEVRQLLPTTSSRITTSSTSSTPPTSSSVPPTSSETSSTPPTSSTRTTVPPTSSTTTASVTSTPQQPPTTSSPSITPSSTPTTTDESSQSVIIQTTVVVIETTGADGQKTSISSSATITSTAGLSQATGSSGPGITDSTRNIIIGVCVGVGGAIILGVLGFVFWRLRNRRNQHDDHDDLAGTSEFNHGHDKSDHSGSVSGRSPFQSTLESYHAPSQANTASNF